MLAAFGRAQPCAQKFKPAALQEQVPVTLHDPRAWMRQNLGKDADFELVVDRLGADIDRLLSLACLHHQRPLSAASMVARRP